MDNNKLQSFLDSLPENYNILDAQVSIDTQFEYFNLAKKVKQEFDYDNILSKKSLLHSADISTEEKKELLIQIASVDKPEAFRIIEKYIANSDKDLHDWALLALQDSKMLLQGKYLDEPQVFISTGLGGKGKLLRYFIVFFSKKDRRLTKTQYKVVKNEIDAFFKNIEYSVESMELSENSISLTILLPIEIDLKADFEFIIKECNVYGNFLDNKCILTNIKILSEQEIAQIKNSDNYNENLS